MGLSWISVTNFDEAIKFYTEVLGLEVKEVNEEWGWAELTTKTGVARLGLARKHEQEPVKPGHNAIVTFTVDNIEDAIKDLEKQGVTLVGAVMEVPGHVKLQTFTDKDGNTFQLVELMEA